jgi:hypothetical protein
MGAGFLLPSKDTSLNSPESSAVSETEKQQSQAPEADSGSAAADEHARRQGGRNGKRRRKDSESAESSTKGCKRNRRQRRAEKRAPGSEEGPHPRSRKAARRAARKQGKEEDGTSAGTEPRATDERGRTKPEKAGRKKKGREKSARTTKGGRRLAACEKPTDESPRDDDELEDGLGNSEVADPDDGDSTVAQSRKNKLRSPVATAVLVSSDDVRQILFNRLKDRFSLAGLELTPTISEANLVVALGKVRSDAAIQAKRGVRLEFTGFNRESPEYDPNEFNGEGDTIPLPMANLLRRFPDGVLVDPKGNPTDMGGDVLAATARDAALIFRGGVVLPPSATDCRAPDLVEAMARAQDVTEVLTALSWPSASPPASIGAAVSQHVVESFLDDAIGYRGRGENKTLPLPFDWAAAPASRNITVAALGLDFAAGVLSYWFQKANKSRSKRIAQIDALVKQKNVTASGILDRVGQLILEATAKSVTLPPEAWQLTVTVRRARAMVLYLLCCRMAAQRKIKFDQAACTPIFRALVDILERIRWAGYGRLGTSSAMASAINIAGLALPLRNTPFGATLSNDCLETLKRHLAVGLSPDGVWRQGFADHDRVLQSLRTFLGDLRTAGVAQSDLADGLAQMARFTVSFLRHDGYSPSLGGLSPKRYRASRAAAQFVLRSKKKKEAGRSAGDGLEDASLFSEAGYFTSRSPEKKGAISSHLVVSAADGPVGGPTLSFSCGSSLILVGGGSMDPKAPADVRRATQRNPAAHNTVRVDDRSYPMVRGEDLGRLQIERAWEEKSWAGARLVNHLFSPANITRTVIHLKPLHALLVVDEMYAGETPRKFEQFWHLGPELKPHQRQAHHFRLAMGDGHLGGVVVAFDSGIPAVPRIGGPEPIGWTAKARGEVTRNLYFVREITTSHALTAAFFRYTTSTARHDISVERTPEGWRAVLLCESRRISFAGEGDQVKLAS